LLFVRSVVCVKSIRIERDIDQEPLAFCTQRAARVKNIRIEWDVDREPLAFYMRWFIDRACFQG
jgi:hypothetical protein